MNRIVGVQFRNQGKVYDFDCGHFVLNKGDKVLVITEKGPAVGCVCREAQNLSRSIPERQVKKVFRLATPEEVERYEESCRLEEEVYKFCYARIKERSLPMCLVAVERRFDGSKIVVYFTADGRVDFRALVKDLVREFRTRIEMRQIGVRHQAKMVGGLGICGRPLCCATYINTFSPVTIKMAKEQFLSLNPGKISGMCGRLMCCLGYEHGYYEQVKKGLHKIGKRISIRRGEGKVVRQNVLRRTLTIALDSGEEMEISPEEIVRNGPSKAKGKRSNR